ncbi:uncharacterized protein LOC135135573 [Zophobas morio]|uniref:uncharacterized protein LOC135135573 n=1 Tax=Zophobas morio TaxID=2755281 RepID=UPI0030828E7A
MYDLELAYETDKSVALGAMNHKCIHCLAYKSKEEAPGICCAGGKVQLPTFEPLPEPLHSLIMGLHPEQLHMDGIRKYNSCFQMTSFGAKKIMEDGFMPTFKVHGQVYHLVCSLLPLPQQDPQFLQIYFIGEDEREANLRCSNFSGVKPNLVKQLQAMLHENNSHIRDLKTPLQKVPEDCEKFEVVIHADRKPANAHTSRYNATTSEVALVIVGQQFEKRDIVLQNHDNKLHRISVLHRSYDAVQYPLLFCYGEDGYSIDIPQYYPKTKTSLQKTISALNFYSYRIMVREDGENRLLYYRIRFIQYLVDMYAKIETERLNYIRYNQAYLRVDSYVHLKDAIGRQDTDIVQLGNRVVLPSSFTGSPRYMHERTQDAMTYVRHYGRRDLFITFTCNPQWKDIADALLPGQKPHDRHDISQVFHLKVKAIMSLLTKENLFGKVRCFMYSVEWQKRGLPQIHILLWLEQRVSAVNIDNVICAEIPDPQKDPILDKIIKTNMIHGPCGNMKKSPCIKGGCCSKKYRRILLKETQTGDDVYLKYRRRGPADGGFTVEVHGVTLENRWVVPKNPVLSRTFAAHINIEYLHLENGQRVYFNPNDFNNVTEKVNNPQKTTLLAFFDLCKTDNFAKTLLYVEIPSYYVWKSTKFERRKRGNNVDGWPRVKKDQALGRVYTVHPNNAECYYLRLLLHQVRGPTSFSDLKTTDGVVYPTYQSSCKALGLLVDDKHWNATMEEAALTDSPFKLRIFGDWSPKGVKSGV